MSTYLSLPGTNGAYASVPDSAALSLIGELDIRVKAALTDWTPAVQCLAVAKFVPNVSGEYALRIATTGRLAMAWQDVTLVAPHFGNSSASPTVTDGADLWIRVTRSAGVYNAGNDSYDYTVTYYTSPDGSVWTQLGTTVNIAAGSADTDAGVQDSSNDVAIGSYSNGTNATIGKIYNVDIKSTIGGTSVLTIDFTNQTPGATSFTCTTGQTVTINGTASIAGTASVTTPPATTTSLGAIGLFL